MQSDFPNLYPYKQTKVQTILYPTWVMSSVIWPLLVIFSFMHSWFILQHLINANPLTTSSCSCKASHYKDQFKIINSCLIFHLPNMLAFTYVMISHNIEAISLIPFALLSFVWTRLFLWSSNTTIHNFALYFNTIWNTIKFAYLLNLGYTC
jgi:hypothetical protein